MNGELQQDHRPRYGIRQAVFAIVVSLVAIGGIAVLSGGDEDAGSVSPALDGLLTATSSAPSASAPTSASATTSTLVPIPVSTRAASAPTALPPISAAAYAVYDATNDVWLAASRAETPLPVGSVMKLLTSYVVLQAGDLAKVVTVPDLQMDIKESSIGLYPGEQISREVLLRAMLIVSANDAARTLAIDVGGTTEAFVQQMNAAATGLGLSDTVAANPVGLDATGAQSSARDMITLASVLLQDETFRAAVAKTSANLHGQTFAATNKLLTSYDGATGVKTGHTTQAGYCLVASATRDGRTLIVAVLGAPTDQQRLADATALLDWGFAHP